MANKKIAVFLYGQPRFLDNPHSYTSQIKHIFQKFEVDVFGHLWWSEFETGYDYSKWEGDGTYHPFLNNVKSDPNTVIKITEKYSPCKIQYEESKCFINPPLYSAITKRFNNENLFTVNNLSNFLSQAKSIETVSDLYEDYLTSGGEPHDLFVLLRTDLNILEFPDLNKLNKNRFYMSGHHDNFPDLIFVFGIKFLKFCKLYSYMMSDKCIDDVKKMNGAYGEQFKLLNYKNNFFRFFIKKINMPCYVVRNNFDYK
jgi:hypothetical protein